MEEYCGLSDGECLVGVEAGAGATTMTQTNQLEGTARENPSTHVRSNYPSAASRPYRGDGILPLRNSQAKDLGTNQCSRWRVP